MFRLVKRRFDPSALLGSTLYDENTFYKYKAFLHDLKNFDDASTVRPMYTDKQTCYKVTI